jgi:hypothetical protein
MSVKSLFERARSYVGKMDAAIEGQQGDKQTFVVACKLVEFGLDQGEAMAVLSEYNLRCQPAWDEKGLQRKLQAAYSRVSPNPKFTQGQYRPVPGFVQAPTQSRWPKLNESLINRISVGGISTDGIIPGNVPRRTVRHGRGFEPAISK